MDMLAVLIFMGSYSELTHILLNGNRLYFIKRFNSDSLTDTMRIISEQYWRIGLGNLCAQNPYAS